MTEIDNPSNNNPINKTRKTICASTKKTYEGRLKSLAITDYTNIDEVNQQIDKVKNLGTKKSSCNALIYYYNSQSTPTSSSDQRSIPNSDKILKLLHDRINTLSDKINYDRQENKLISKKDKEQFMNWSDIISMRNNITDPFERLIILLYTYIPPRRREDYYLMYYSNKTYDEMFKKDKTKNYITSDRWFIFNKYKTDSTYGQQKFECPNEIYQQIINLTYLDKEDNEQHYKDGDRLFFNITNPNTFSNYVSNIFENHAGKHVTITVMRISFITDYYSNGLKTLNERITLAKQMAHSVDEQLQYMKILNYKPLSESELGLTSSSDKVLDPSSDKVLDSSSDKVLDSSSIPSVPLSCSSSTSSIPSLPSPSSTSTTSSPVIPMSKDQFKEFMNKLSDNIYDNLYGQLYNNIKSEILASLPENKSSDKVITSSTKRIKSKNTKKNTNR